MSLLVIGKIPADVGVFRQALAERAGEFAKVSDRARAAGGVHHRFGLGDGFVLVVDEWETVEEFQQFFGDPELQAFIGSVGATGEPDLVVAAAIDAPGQY